MAEAMKESLTLPHIRGKDLRFPLLVAVSYVTLFLLLAELAHVFEMEPTVRVWWPPAGLALILIGCFGLRYAPVLVITCLLEGLLIESFSLPLGTYLVSTFIISMIYAGGGELWRRIGQPQGQPLADMTSVSIFFSIALTTPFLAALAFNAVLALDSRLMWENYFKEVGSFWVGDVVGILIVTPPLLVWVIPAIERWRADGTPPKLSLGGDPNPVIFAAMMTLGTMATAWFIFDKSMAGGYHLLYLFFVPMFLIALAYGIRGGTLGIALINIAATSGFLQYGDFHATLQEVQTFMIVFSLVGLFLSTVVTARRKTQQTISEYTTLYETLLNALSERVFMLDNDWRVVFANTAAERARNMTADDYLNQNYLELFPSIRETPFEACIRETMQTQQPNRVVSQLADENGRLRWFDFQVNPVPGGVLCLSTDMTEVKRVELALMESERQFRSIFSSAAIGIGIIGLEGQIIDSNQAFRSLLGYDQATLHTMSLADVIHEDDAQQHHAMLQAIINGQRQQYQLELRFITHSGSTVWCNLTVSIDFDSDDESLFIIAMLEDVSEKHHATQALRQREAQLKQQYKNIPVPTYIWQEKDGDFLLMDYNLAAETFTNGRIVTALGQKASDRYAHDQATLDDFRQCYEQRTTITRSGRFSLPSMDDEKFLIVSFVYIQPNLVMVHTIDLTERQRAEERFRSLAEHTSEAILCYEYDPPISIDLPREEQIKRLYDGILVECNDIAARAYGAYRAEDVRGKPLTDMVGLTPRGLDHFFTTFIEGGYRAVELEVRDILEGDKARFFLVNGHSVIEDGKLLRVWSAFRDISDRKHARDALGQSQQQLQALFDHSRDAILIADDNGRCVNANAAAYELFGLEAGQLIGHTVADFSSPAARERYPQTWSDFLKMGEDFGEQEIIRDDGSIRLAQYSARANFLPGQHVTFLRDITEQRWLESAENEQRIFAQSLHDMATDLLDSTFDSKDVLDRILLHVERAIAYDGAIIALADNGIVRPARHRGSEGQGLSRALRVFNMSIEHTKDLQVMSQTRAPYRIDDTRQDEHWRPLPGLEWVRAFLGAPIVTEDVVGGFLILFHKDANAFSENDGQKLKAFADQAAVAMENARLYQIVQQRVAELELLWQSGLNITAWLEDEQAVLEHVLDAALTLDSAADVAGIFLYDEGGIHLGAMRWAPNKSPRANLQLRPHELHHSTSLDDDAVFHEDVLASELFSGDALVGKAGLMNLPLMGRAKTLGVMSIYYLDNRKPSQEHLRAARLLSFQAAAGIEHAQIYSKLEQYVAEISKLSHATSSLFTSLSTSQDLDEVYEGIIDCVLNAFGQVDCGIIAVDNQTGTLRRLARKGQYHVRAHQDINVEGAGLVPAAIRTGEMIYAPDVRRDPRYVANEPRTRSELVVPLKQGNAVIAVLDLQSAHLDAFNRSDQRLMHAFASRAATAIENVQLMQNLRDGEERFRQLAENVTDVFFLCSLNFGELLYVSPAYQSVWGIDPDPLFEDFETEFMASVHPDDQEHVSSTMREASRQLAQNATRPGHIEFRIVAAGGESRWIRMQLFPVENETGQVYRIAILAQDSTEQKRAASLSAAGEIATGVAHQINNPLTAIIAQSHLVMKRLPADSQLRENMSVVVKAAYRAGAVAQRMLEFSQVAHYDFRHLDVNEGAQYAIELVRAQIEPDEAQLLVDLTIGLPLINGSQHHLEDLWLNLILNARDAVHEAKSPEIRISSALTKSGTHVEVVIQDNGHGIPEENVEHIFDPFFTTKSHGNGLGLAVCRDIAIKHGGDIYVESVEGQGATFRVRLPIIKAEIGVQIGK